MTNIKLKIGDRVKYTSDTYVDSEYNPLWEGNWGKVEGTITDIVNDIPFERINVLWDNKQTNSYLRKDLEPVKETIEMTIKRLTTYGCINSN